MEILGGKRGIISVPGGEFSDGFSFPTLHKLQFALNGHRNLKINGSNGR